MKRLVKTFFLIAGLAIASFLFFQKENGVNDLVFENIDALAASEGTTGTWCYGSGNIDCSGAKVEFKISGYSLPINVE